MIRFSKILFMNPAQIWVSGIECSYDNIIKISNIFECKWIALTIDSLPERSQFLTFIKTQGLKYLVKQQLNYTEISVAVPHVLFTDVLKKAISEDFENIWIYNLLDPTSWNEQLWHPYEKLVITGITDVVICISTDENVLSVFFNKFLLPAKEVYKKIKALRFE